MSVVRSSREHEEMGPEARRLGWLFSCLVSRSRLGRVPGRQKDKDQSTRRIVLRPNLLPAKICSANRFGKNSAAVRSFGNLPCF